LTWKRFPFFLLYRSTSKMYTYSPYPPRAWLNPYPYAFYTNTPFYLDGVYLGQNRMAYVNPSLETRYGTPEQCTCDVYHTMGECLQQRRMYHCA